MKKPEEFGKRNRAAKRSASFNEEDMDNADDKRGPWQPEVRPVDCRGPLPSTNFVALRVVCGPGLSG